MSGIAFIKGVAAGFMKKDTQDSPLGGDMFGGEIGDAFNLVNGTEFAPNISNLENLAYNTGRMLAFSDLSSAALRDLRQVASAAKQMTGTQNQRVAVAGDLLRTALKNGAQINGERAKTRAYAATTLGQQLEAQATQLENDW